MKPSTSALVRNWHVIVAITYVLIEVTDFVVMPTVFAAMNRPVDPLLLISAASKLSNPTAQLAALHMLSAPQEWHPLTLGGNGLFQIAMTTLLGSGLWSKAWLAKGSQSSDTSS